MEFRGESEYVEFRPVSVSDFRSAGSFNMSFLGKLRINFRVRVRVFLWFVVSLLIRAGLSKWRLF